MMNTLSPKENTNKVMEQMQLRFILSEKIHEMKMKKDPYKRYMRTSNTSRINLHSLNSPSTPKVIQKAVMKTPMAQKRNEMIPSYLTDDKQQAKIKAAAIHVIGQFHDNFNSESAKFKHLMTIMSQSENTQEPIIRKAF